MEKSTSITDRPIRNANEEALDIGSYASALVSFIKDSATPLTIGIQGEWGSGKTSIMHLIRNEVDQSGLATAWVNTWEFSIFRDPHETTPSIMRGLLENLKAECAEVWPKALNDRADKVANVLKGFGKLMVNAAGKHVLGVSNTTDHFSSAEEAAAQAEMAEIRRDISSIIQTLVDDPQNPYKKVVFFVDDLDRIEPSMAVEILEALKNLFDVKNCIFVLAIDYDVVVKGLESKFGPKTDENDREFRSFFDKIIQVPFTMPVGVYNIENLIQSRLDELGFSVSGQLQNNYREIVAQTVGPNPRSIKRYINTYSLLRRIEGLETSNRDAKERGNYDFALFALVGIQIAYPKVYSLIVDEPDYVNWKEQFAHSQDITVDVPEIYKEHQYLDEYWEQLVWSYCQSSSYLKSRALQVLTALNTLRKTVGDDNLEETINESLQVTNITSVDESKNDSGKKFVRERLDSWDGFAKLMKSKGKSDAQLAVMQAVYDKLSEAFAEEDIFINLTGGGVVTFNANIPGKVKKVFCYNTFNAKGVSSHLGSNDEKRVLTDPSHVDDEFLSLARQSYTNLLAFA